MKEGADIGRILLIEFSDQNSAAIDEAMKSCSDFENLELKDEALPSVPGLEIYPNRRKIYRGVGKSALQ